MGNELSDARPHTLQTKIIAGIVGKLERREGYKKGGVLATHFL